MIHLHYIRENTRKFRGRLPVLCTSGTGAYRVTSKGAGIRMNTAPPTRVQYSWFVRAQGYNNTPYHPRSDGFIERSFRTLGRCLKAACRETKQEWDELVPLILISYRATPQASTGVTPNMMMLGRQTRLPVQAMYGAPLGPEEE